MKAKQLFLFFILLAAFPVTTSAQSSASGTVRVPRNVFTAAPLAVFYGGVGGGLGYERFIDRERKTSISLAAYSGIRNYLIGNYALSRTDDERAQNYSFMVLPGIKLYPRGQRRVLNYAIGTHLLLVKGSENGYKQSFTNASYEEFSTGSEMRVGSVISNAWSVNISPRFCIGAEALVGCSFITKIKSNQENSLNQDGGVKPMGALVLSVGYRF